ncbi:P-loop containing dynein motor region D4-domain-containing protein, partial [Baffinella frigidus]
KLVCFIDDVNMPAREEYGAQPPVELLRLCTDTLEYYRLAGGIWDKKKLWNDVVFVGACGPPGGGRNIVTARFFRFFSMLNISPPSQAVLKVIFSSILDGHLSTFQPDIKLLGKATVDSSIEIYEKISAEMLPTPAKSHYTFNLRDLSKVFQGILSLGEPQCGSTSIFARLWLTPSLAQNVFLKHCTTDRPLLEHNPKPHTHTLNLEPQTPNPKPPTPNPKPQTPNPKPQTPNQGARAIPDHDKLPKLMDAYLDDYNNASSKAMDLVFFMDAIEHISRLARIIRSPRGNAMLVGLGGSGKQSLTRLSAFMAEFKCFQIELAKGYGNNEFREDMKKIFQIAGVERIPVVFLFTDSQIVNEGFVEDINSILNAGDVPNLFPADEKDRIISDCREYTASIGQPLTKDSVYKTFISCVQANLHCVLSMSPVGEAFRRRCRMFPSLINCCTIDWYMPWPQEALLSVAQRFFGSMEQGISDEYKESLAGMCPFVHGKVEEFSDKFYSELRRKFYISPKSYLDMIQAPP